MVDPFSELESERPVRGRPIWAGLACLAAAAAFFGLTGSPYPYAGESANLLAMHADLTPFRPVTQPLWGVLVRAVSITGLPLATLMNGVSALLTAWSLFLVFRIVENSLFHNQYREAAPRMPMLAGFAAVVFLATVYPIWLLGTRAHFGALDLALILLTLRLIQRFRDSRSGLTAWTIGLLHGLGVVQSPEFALLAPVTGAYLLLTIWRRRAGWNRVAFLAGGALLGLLCYLVVALDYLRQPISQWTEAGLYNVIAMMGTTTIKTTLNYVPAIGWMVIFMVSGVPFLGALWAKTEAPLKRRPTGIMPFYAAVLLLAVGLLCNLQIAPWKAQWMRYSSPMLAVIVALYFGYAVGFWYTFFVGRAAKNPGGRIAATTLFALLLAGVAATGFHLNREAILPDGNERYYRLERSKLEGRFPPKTLLAEEAPGVLLIAAHDKKLPMEVLRFKDVRDPVRRLHMESKVKTTRLKSLLEISPTAMLKAWLSERTNSWDQLALSIRPAYWTEAGYAPVPNRGYYFGVRDFEELPKDELHQDMTAFLEDVKKLIPFHEKPEHRMEFKDNIIRSLYARLANDYGILQESVQQPDRAAAAYQTALDLYDQNISALVNLHYLEKSRGVENPERWNRISSIVNSISPRELYLIPSRFGFIKQEAFEITRTLLTSPDGKKSEPLENHPAMERYQQVALLIQEKKLKEADTLARSILKDHPDFEPGWTVLSVIAFYRDDVDTVEDCLTEMKERNTLWMGVMLIAGELAYKNKQYERARRIYELLAQVYPWRQEILVKLILIDVADGNLSAFSRTYLNSLLSLNPDSAFGNFYLGLYFLNKGQYAKAENCYRNAIREEVNTSALNNIAYVMFLQKKYEEALPFVEESLAREPENINALDTKANLLISLNRYEEAWKVLQTALQLEGDHVDLGITQMYYYLSTGNEAKAQTLRGAYLGKDQVLEPEQTRRLRAIFEEKGLWKEE